MKPQPDLFDTPQSPKIHDFKECLKFSHIASAGMHWEVIYRQAFPTMMSMSSHNSDGAHQRAGIDRSIILSSARQILVDEKMRGRNKKTGKVYEDIALEELHEESRGGTTPGWAVKLLMADYIAYCIAPLGKCYLLPVPQMQAAWLMHGSLWKEQYPQIRAFNKRYISVSWGIPVPVLFKAIGDCLRTTFDPFEYSELE